MLILNPRLKPILLFIIFFACSQSPEQQSNQAPVSPLTNNTTVDQIYLPSITVEEIQSLWTSTNQIDYIFYELPISSSIDNSPSAQAHLRHISDTPVNQSTKAKCQKGLGRAFYKSNGEDLLEAEIFFSEQCAFFIFYKNGKATYANLMTQDGVNFFSQMVSAVQTTQTNPNG